MTAGPISLLVTTNAVPSSTEHITLLSKLVHIQSQHVALKTRLVVHVLHLAPAAEPQPNAFLNLARLLSPSPRAVLFPGNLSYAPPKTLYKTLLSQQPSSSSALSPAGHARRRKPAVLTAKDHTSFPFAPLAPVVIARDDTTWCTERFFAGMSRAGDWEECLWQVWLANFGGVEVKQVQGWASSRAAGNEDASDASENPAAVSSDVSALWSRAYTDVIGGCCLTGEVAPSSGVAFSERDVLTFRAAVCCLTGHAQQCRYEESSLAEARMSFVDLCMIAVTGMPHTINCIHPFPSARPCYHSSIRSSRIRKCCISIVCV